MAVGVNTGQQPQRKKNRFRWENRRRWTSRDWENQPKVRVASIEVRPHWKLASELPLSELESASLPFMEAEARSKRNRVKYGRDRSSRYLVPLSCSSASHLLLQR